MDAQEGFQALQEHLSNARRHLEAGDHDQALELIDAALAIDAKFLAAYGLRDRVRTGDLQPDPAIAQPASDSTQPGLERLEQIARQRRIERCLTVASASLASGKLAAAQEALVEVRRFDPAHPDITRLEIEIASARRTRARRAWAWSAAACVLALIVFGLWRLDRLVAPISSDSRDPVPAPQVADLSSQARPSSEPFVAAPSPSPIDADLAPSMPALPAGVQPPVVPTGAEPDRSLATDDRQIRQVLEKYRAAYEGLDARSTRQASPAVDESQRVTFAACDIDVRGTSATAECSGTARYVGKVGNQEPRIEPRNWTFMLHRDGSEWRIDQARADR